jgi:hypothetical protein
MAYVCWVLVTTQALGQTNPTPQALPYSQNFGTTTFTSMPAGMAAWNGLNGSDDSTLSLAESSVPSGDATVTAATTSTTSGGGLWLCRCFIQQCLRLYPNLQQSNQRCGSDCTIHQYQHPPKHRFGL